MMAPNKDGASVDKSRRGGGFEEGTLKSLKEFIKKENQNIKAGIVEDLKKLNEERMAAIENALSFSMAESEGLKRRLDAAEERGESYHEGLSCHEQRIQELEKTVDTLQQAELREWLVFRGKAIPRWRQGENLLLVLGDMLEQLMGLDLDGRQILRVIRDGRSLRVRFSSAAEGSDRDWLLKNKTRLKGKNLFIQEALSSLRQGLFEKMTDLKWSRKVAAVFTRNGNVMVVVQHGEYPRPVRSMEAAERVLREVTQPSADAGQGSPRAARPDGARPELVEELRAAERSAQGATAAETSTASPASPTGEPLAAQATPPQPPESRAEALPQSAVAVESTTPAVTAESTVTLASGDQSLTAASPERLTSTLRPGLNAVLSPPGAVQTEVAGRSGPATRPAAAGHSGWSGDGAGSTDDSPVLSTRGAVWKNQIHQQLQQTDGTGLNHGGGSWSRRWELQQQQRQQRADGDADAVRGGGDTRIRRVDV